MNTLNLEELRKAVSARDEIIEQFSTFIDELMKVLHEAKVCLPRKCMLEYFPSGEYTFSFFEGFKLTHGPKDTHTLQLFADLFESGFLEEVLVRVDAQRVSMESAIKKGKGALA